MLSYKLLKAFAIPSFTCLKDVTDMVFLSTPFIDKIGWKTIGYVGNEKQTAVWQISSLPWKLKIYNSRTTYDLRKCRSNRNYNGNS